MTGGPSDNAESLFAEFLERRENLEDLTIEEWCARHPAHETELKQLWSDLRFMGDVGDPDAFASPPAEPELEAEFVTLAGPAPGRRIDDFVLLEALGEGGMGQVWRARQLSLGRIVALKLVRPDRVSERTLRLLAREARAGGRLSHPGIVAVHAYGELDGIAWIAMELVEGGRTLRHVLDEATERGELDPAYLRRMIEVVAALADALQAAHSAGVIHRDLKPQNVMLDPEGRPKLTDFGLARIVDEPALSNTGDFAGTYFYMSPEQVAARRMGIDHRTDVFSLGIVLYEILALRRPFDGATSHHVAEQILTKDPPDLRKVGRGVPQDLAVICAKALEKDRDHRFQSMAELAADLRRFLTGAPVLARPLPAVVRAWRLTRRRPWKSAALMMFGLGLPVATLSVSLWSGDRVKASAFDRDRAISEGFQLLAADRFELALTAFSRASALDPGSLECLTGRVLRAIDGGDVELASREVERYSRAHPEAGTAKILRRLVALQRSGDAPDLGELESAVEPLDHFLTGLIFLRLAETGEEDQAARALEHISIAVRSTREPPALYHYEQVRAAALAGDREEALAAADVLERLWPDIPETWYWVGYALDEFEPARAVEAYRRALEMGVYAEVRTRRSLAGTLHLAGELAEAVELYDSLLEEEPDDVDLLTVRARALCAQQRYDVAIEGLRAAAERLDDVSIDHALGTALYEANELEDAREVLRSCVEEYPGYIDAYLDLSLVLDDLEEYSESVRVSEACVENNPESVEAHLDLAAAYTDAWLNDEARKILDRALELDPDNLEIRADLADLLVYSGEYEAAIPVLERIAARDWLYSIILARAYLGAERRQDAIDALRSVEERWIPGAALWSEVGEIYEHAGAIDDAIRVHERWVDEDPGALDGHEALAMSLVRKGLAGRVAGEGATVAAALEALAEAQLEDAEDVEFLEDLRTQIEAYEAVLPRIDEALEADGSDLDHEELRAAAECLYFAQEYGASARFYTWVVDRVPDESADADLFYFAASSASLASGGAGRDAHRWTAQDRSSWRTLAIAWMETALARNVSLVEEGGGTELLGWELDWELASWLEDPDLAPIRDREKLLLFSAEDHAAAEDFWDAVHAARGRTPR